MTTIGCSTSRPFPSRCNAERVARNDTLKEDTLDICARDLPIVAEMPVVALNIKKCDSVRIRALGSV